MMKIIIKQYCSSFVGGYLFIGCHFFYPHHPIPLLHVWRKRGINFPSPENGEGLGVRI